MRKLTLTAIIVFSIIIVPISVNAMTWVDGHWSNGTWVEGHYRTEPNDYEWDNLGSDGIDIDNDGYGAGAVNDLYDYNDNDIYDGYEYDTGLDSYNTYDYDTGLDSYDTDYGGYDSYDYGGYDSYDLSW